MARSIFCSRCKIEKEPGRQSQSYCKECRGKHLEATRAKAKSVEPRPRRPKGNYLTKGLCPDCGVKKENPKQSYCNGCRSKRSKEWTLETGRVQKHRTGLCPCGVPRAANQPYFCADCKMAESRKFRKNRAYTEDERVVLRARRRDRYHELAESRRQRYETDEGYRNQVNARKEVTKAIRDGILIPQPCEVCDYMKTDAHHDDYTKPLDVRWLCRSHHVLHHSRNIDQIKEDYIL